MRRLTPLLGFMLLAACADQAPLQPEVGSARLSTTTAPTFTIRANTFGPGGDLWIESSPKKLLGTRVVIVQGGHVKWEYYSGSSALSSGGDSPFYNGGDVQVFAVGANGAETWLGNVTADMSDAGHALEVPAGTNLRLRAYTNRNCVFNYYRTQSGNVRSATATVAGGSVVAYFYCNEDYGTPL